MVECACAPAVVNPLSVSIQLEFWKNHNVSYLNSSVFQTLLADYLVLYARMLALLDWLLLLPLVTLPVFAQKLRFYVDEYQIEYHVERTPLCLFCFEKFAHLSGCSVKWFTDNQVVPLIVDCGCMKQCSHQLAVDIIHTAKENNVKIKGEWIRRSLRACLQGGMVTLASVLTLAGREKIARVYKQISRVG